MALDAELINLKSAGVYRFERDKSTISNDTITIPNMRLVVGFSKTGPFNTVKLVNSSAEFIKLYGNIDRSLEKKGSFFHRSALVALSAGPILCLNLLNLDPDKDQVVEKSFSVSSGDVNRNSVTLPLQTLYNTDKFWYPSDEAFLDGIKKCLDSSNTTLENENWANSILHFSNIGKKPISILIKKANEYSSKNYQITLNEWYGDGNVPEYLNGTSFVSDYLVEVYVVEGDFGPALVGTTFPSSIDLDDDGGLDGGNFDILTKYSIDDSSDAESPYKRFSSDIVYQSYFDDGGFIRGENDVNLNKFLNLPSVELRAKYVGSLIPNFIDKTGKNIWIQKLVNDDTDTIGIICVENIDLLEDVKITEKFIHENIDLVGNDVFSYIVDHTDENPVPNVPFDFLSYTFNYEEKVQKVKDKDGRVYAKRLDSMVDSEFEFNAHPFAWDVISDEGDTEDFYYSDSSVATVGTKLYMSKNESDAEYVVVSEIVEDINPLMVEFKPKVMDCDFYTSADKNLAKKHGELKGNEVVLDLGSNVVVGDYILSGYSSEIDADEDAPKYSRVSRVIAVKNVYVDNGYDKYSKDGLLVVCADEISIKRGFMDNMVVKINPVDRVADRLHWTCLNGFQARKSMIPDGTNERQNMILDMIRENPLYESTYSNLFKSLIDRDYVQWRYLVDSFGLGLEEECKNVYTQLCQARKSSFAIISCPSQLDFKKSIDPSFTNKIGGVEAEFIAKGGDLSKNPSFLFSLPKIENGASWGAYYYPYLRITDLGAAKSVPPAPYVSNLYIQKYNRGFAWSIVAGQKRGVISGNQVAGVEATLVHDNRDWLEPAGINPIIWEQGVGVEVYGNKTAKHTPVSALSSAHVREAAIYIQDGVESILRRYIWEFNTAQTRLEIKTLVDDFLNTMKSNDGLYDFRTVMDTTNNTAEIIDHNQGVIDIYVEIVRGLEIISQRLTILKTGSIAAGGFDE